MKKFKNLFAVCLLFVTCFIFGCKVCADNYQINLVPYKHFHEFGHDTRPKNDGVRFDLISPKGNVVFEIHCVQYSDVPRGMSKELLGELCAYLMIRCKKESHSLGKLSISREQYFEFMEICQIINGKRKSLSERELAMKDLILKIAQTYNI